MKKPQRTEFETPLQRFVNTPLPTFFKPRHDDIVITPRNISQNKFLYSISTNTITVATGPAGCGKTFLPTLQALDDLVKGEVEKIVIVRPSVEVEGENDPGALPGGIGEKYGPQVKAITDTMIEYLGSSKLMQLIAADVIEIVPVAFLRGRSFKNAWIIVDEAQNLSRSGMMAVLTRVGKGCKMVVVGDVDQTDRFENNGLEDLIDRLDRNMPKNVGYVSFSVKDIEREPVVADIVKLYK